MGEPASPGGLGWHDRTVRRRCRTPDRRGLAQLGELPEYELPGYEDEYIEEQNEPQGPKFTYTLGSLEFDQSGAAPMHRAFYELGGAPTCLAAALRKEGALLGVLSIYRREVRPFPDRQAAFVNESEAAVAPDETDTKAEMLGRHDRTHRFAYTAGSKASASCQRQSTSSPAGSARANAAAWPAQACKRSRSRDLPAASRIAAVRALCTG